MTRDRWDETWHRLREWTNSSGQSERLAAQLLLFDNYEGVDPSHPLGGPDGGKDILCMWKDLRCLAAVYFPKGRQEFREIKKKFRADFQMAESQRPPIDRFVFITNQDLRLSEREELHQAAMKVAHGIEVVLYHLERITAILDSPGMHSVRRQFLGIEGDSKEGRGGRGGSAYAIGNRSTAIDGLGGRGGLGPGGDGGHSVATGDQSVGIGGNGGGSAQSGGIGGQGGRGPLDKFGTPSESWGVGRGGRGGCTPEFIRLSAVLSSFCREYSERFDQDALFIDAGLEQVPTDWLNQRLMELGERWRVDGDSDAIRTLRSLDR